MGDKENPIITRLTAEKSDIINKTWEVILNKIKETDGLPPKLFSTPLVRVANYDDPEYDFEHRFLVQWRVNRVYDSTLNALENLVQYFHKPSLVQGRRDVLNTQQPPRKYPTIYGGKSEKMMGYLLRKWGVQTLRSTGIWVCREFENGKDARKQIRHHRGWLYNGKAIVELREGDKIAQLDFAERVVQMSYVLKHNKPLECAPLLYSIYRDLNRIDIEEKTEKDVAGLEEIINFVKWTLFASSKSAVAAEYFHCKPESVLLAGVKGTGKTLIAEVLASQDHNMLFVPVSAIQLTMEKYNSKGKSDSEEDSSTVFSAVKHIQTRANARINLHCDDVDAVLALEEGASGEARATNSTLLNKLSGIKQSKYTTLTGSTNDPGIIDERFLRFGRIGYLLHVSLPNDKARDAILAIHTRGMPLASDVNLACIAKNTDGYTPAALAEICNSAARNALIRCSEAKGKEIGKSAFEALPELDKKYLEGKHIEKEDFEKAHSLVAKYANAEQNKVANQEIKKFCDSYNDNKIGFRK
jgi:ATP-dependent 26S proteasome regulatory subunit